MQNHLINFTTNLLPNIGNCEITHRHYHNSDFGSLDEYAFDSSEKGGHVQFWGKGFISFFLIDYKTGETIIPETMINEDQCSEIERLLSLFTKVFNTK